MSSTTPILEYARFEPVTDADAYRLGEIDTTALCEVARARRDRAWGRTLTFSPKVFLPITNLCRNHCDYCSFRRSPGDAGEWTMSPDEVRSWLHRAREQGCIEALFCLGDTPETGFRDYRALLHAWGHERTVDYLRWAAEEALAAGLLPHTNAGILTREDMIALRPVNVSLGLMLENVSDRLCERGMPHHRAPDKRPAKRVQMTREAGELRIPFTSGLLIGIGETVEERIETMLTIRRLHREYGHIGEVIVQNFRAHPDTPMSSATEPALYELAATIALARLILDDDVSVQAPPNLNLASMATLIEAGINDFGGVSPVSPDYINPRHPWPHVDQLREACETKGFRLEPRLPLYPAHLDAPGFVDASLRPSIARLQTELAAP
jgi:FO synthase